MFKIKWWWNKKEEYDLKQNVEKVTIWFSNCGNETMIDVDLLETDYQETITAFVLNTMLHHVGMIRIN